jgi:hypothetical protein
MSTVSAADPSIARQIFNFSDYGQLIALVHN